MSAHTSITSPDVSARPLGRARIETTPASCFDGRPPLAPDLRVGRGLKRLPVGLAQGIMQVAPNLWVGRGLKQLFVLCGYSSD